MRKTSSEAHAMDRTTMAAFERHRVGKWPPDPAPNCENSEQRPLCHEIPSRPIGVPRHPADAYVRAGPRRMSTSAKAVGRTSPAIWCRPARRPPDWTRRYPIPVQRGCLRIATKRRQPINADQFFQLMTAALIALRTVSDQIGEPAGGKPCAVIRLRAAPSASPRHGSRRRRG